ncbi:MAG: hypothetical protein M3Y27_00090, partial [Acidobacteriota bacterium]|nr:hypothetical protein [Acidobacteriota bacterium]
DMVTFGLKRIPTAAPLYIARGVLYVQLGEYEKSDVDFLQAERLDPQVGDAAAAMGMAALQENRLPEAETGIRERLKQHRNDPFLLYLLAETLLRRGAAPGSSEFHEATNAASRAVSIQPRFALARDVLGRLYLEEGKTSEAIEQSRLAVRHDPSDQTALYHLIVALRKDHRTTELPPLIKQLAALREEARTKENNQRKYALVEAANQR